MSVPLALVGIAAMVVGVAAQFAMWIAARRAEHRADFALECAQDLIDRADDVRAEAQRLVGVVAQHFPRSKETP